MNLIEAINRRWKATISRRLNVLAIVVMLELAGCATTKPIADPSPTTASEEAQYTALYPYYAETCALSQIRKKPGFGADISGGVGGHDVLYLNGVCRKHNEDYPVLTMCDESQQRPVLDGVGVTVNGHFKNANWVAIEGRDFFFNGDLAPGQVVNRAAYAAVQARARQQKIFDTIDFHEEYFKDMPADFSRSDYRYEISIATDYAIGFARNRYCARVPLSRSQTIKLIDYLNGLNQPYRERQKIFDWNVLTHNCSHVNHNALAAAGLWFHWPMDRPLLISAFDFPVPKNEFVNLMWRTNEMHIDDPEIMFKDKDAYLLLMTEGRLPTAPGATADLGVLQTPNNIYETKSRIIFYDEPLTGSFQRRFNAIMSQPRFFRLRENLEYFEQLYLAILAKWLPVETYLTRHPGIANDKADQFRAFYQRYHAYIEDQVQVVRRNLAFLNGAPAITTVRQISR